MSEYRTLLEERTGRGAKFEIFSVNRKTHISGQGNVSRYLGRQLRITLTGGSALLEPGALQYSVGSLTAEIQKNEAGGFLRRAVTQAGTGESAFSTRFSGNGEIWTELTAKHFIIAEMDGPADALLLDDKAFYACEGSIQVKAHLHRTLAGALSGNGLMQPKIEGAGVFVVEAPVPVDEIEAIELDGKGELIVDGDLMLMYSATLEVEIRPLVRGLRNALRSGEGLVYAFRGRGTVWLMPTSRVV